MSYIGSDCGATAGKAATPQVTPWLVRAQVVRLVPHLSLRAAPGKGKTLVHIQTILWLDTPASRSLGTVSLLGHEVAITIRVRSVAWDFGDGATVSSVGPGRAYTAADHCGTAQCPGFFGHAYAATGSFTITARVVWAGTYTVDGGPPQQVIGTVDGPLDRLPITVVQARGVLVPNPPAN